MRNGSDRAAFVGSRVALVGVKGNFWRNCRYGISRIVLIMGYVGRTASPRLKPESWIGCALQVASRLESSLVFRGGRGRESLYRGSDGGRRLRGPVGWNERGTLWRVTGMIVGNRLVPDGGGRQTDLGNPLVRSQTPLDPIRPPTSTIMPPSTHTTLDWFHPTLGSPRAAVFSRSCDTSFGVSSRRLAISQIPLLSNIGRTLDETNTFVCEVYGGIHVSRWVRSG